MNLFSRVKKLFVFTALALTLMLSGAFLPSSSRGRAHVGSATSAYPRYSTLTTYYSDASQTQEVGSLYVRCNGSGTRTGTSSPYYTVETIDVCCGNVPC